MDYLLKENSNKEYLADMVKNVIAIIELKYDYGSDGQTISAIKKDVWKIKDYIQNGKMLCQYYFGVIYENGIKNRYISAKIQIE